MSTKYPFIPEYLEKALENTEIPLIDLMHGHLKVVMVDTEQKLNEYTDHVDEQWDQTVDRLHLEGYMEALTEMYCLTYNLSIDRKHIEETQ
jgi:anion-transporting  ArsA/GET3 family ATPase